MFKNKELLRQFLLACVFFIAMTALILYATLGFTSMDNKSMLIVVCGLIGYMYVFYTIFSTVKRYRKIKELSEYVFKLANSSNTSDCESQLEDYFKGFTNESIHNEYMIDAYKEGELSILQSEIYKLTRRMIELNESLFKDKKYLSDSLANISHQLKTPLTSMLVMSDLLNDANLPDEKRKEFTMSIISQLNRIDWLLSTLLKMARFDAMTVKMNPVITELDKIIEKSVEHLRIPMDIRNQTLSIEKQGEFVSAKVDGGWFVEALANICKNCMEHTGENGIITITYGNNSIYTFIKIADNGEGIDEVDLPHIFERFYKGKNSSKDSVGIGLALAKQIVNMNDGYIEVTSTKGKGTTFFIKLYNGNVV